MPASLLCSTPNLWCPPTMVLLFLYIIMFWFLDSADCNQSRNLICFVVQPFEILLKLVTHHNILFCLVQDLWRSFHPLPELSRWTCATSITKLLSKLSLHITMLSPSETNDSLYVCPCLHDSPQRPHQRFYREMRGNRIFLDLMFGQEILIVGKLVLQEVWRRVG